MVNSIVWANLYQGRRGTGRLNVGWQLAEGLLGFCVGAGSRLLLQCFRHYKRNAVHRLSRSLSRSASWAVSFTCRLCRLCNGLCIGDCVLLSRLRFSACCTRLCRHCPTVVACAAQSLFAWLFILKFDSTMGKAKKTRKFAEVKRMLKPTAPEP